MEPPVDACLRMPELLAGVLRFLGPLDWLKCAAVCSWWSTAILDDSSKSRTSAGSVNLWREFATAVMHYELPAAYDEPSVDTKSGHNGHIESQWSGRTTVENGTQSRSCDENIDGRHQKAEGTIEFTFSKRNDALSGGGDPVNMRGGRFATRHANARVDTGCRSPGSDEKLDTSYGKTLDGRIVVYRDGVDGSRRVWGENSSGRSSKPSGSGGVRISPRSLSYKTVCLEGDPAMLRSPRRSGPYSKEIATYFFALTGQVALSRYRRIRIFRKFLQLWAQDQITRGGGRLRRTCKTIRSQDIGSFYSDAEEFDRAVRVFTQVLVLCRRCRRPRTAMFATDKNADSFPRRSLPYHEAGKGGIILWLECHSDGCGSSSRISTQGCAPFLAKFAEYVLIRDWESVNTLPADYGTEWFSDTSPEAVQRRQEEAQASSHGLDALASRSNSIGGNS